MSSTLDQVRKMLKQFQNTQQPQDNYEFNSDRQKQSIIKKLDSNIQRLTKKKIQLIKYIEQLRTYGQKRNQALYANSLKQYQINCELKMKHETNKDVIQMMRKTRPPSARTQVQLSRLSIVQNQESKQIFQYKKNDPNITNSIEEAKFILKSLTRYIDLNLDVIKKIENGYVQKNSKRRNLHKNTNFSLFSDKTKKVRPNSASRMSVTKSMNTTAYSTKAWKDTGFSFKQRSKSCFLDCKKQHP